MMPDGTERPNTRWVIGGIAFILLLFVVVVFILPGRHSRNSGPGEQLQHFAGVLHHGPPTHDPVKSDFYIRASRSLKSGDARSAEAAYREVIAKYPNDPRGFIDLGACLDLENKFEEARTNYLHGLDLDPKSERALYGLGCVAYEQNHYGKAKDYLEKALLQDQQYTLCHRLLGMVYEQLGDTSNAVLHYERAIALDPSDTGVKELLRQLKE
jgi:Flp pilus assembly protein TadD